MPTIKLHPLQVPESGAKVTAIAVPKPDAYGNPSVILPDVIHFAGVPQISVIENGNPDGDKDSIELLVVRIGDQYQNTDIGHFSAKFDAALGWFRVAGSIYRVFKKNGT